MSKTLSAILKVESAHALITILLNPSSKITQNQMFHVLGKEFDMEDETTTINDKQILNQTEAYLRDLDTSVKLFLLHFNHTSIFN